MKLQKLGCLNMVNPITVSFELMFGAAILFLAIAVVSIFIHALLEGIRLIVGSIKRRAK